MPLDPVEILQRLIQTPSVNPMGRDVTGSQYGEGRMTELLDGICEQHHWPCTRQRVHEGRDNLLALVEGDPSPREGGEVLLWDVHQDTVAVDGMTVPQFGGEVRDGRVYGRGACDVKGSMAAMLAALSRITETKPPQRPTIILACTANEECGFTGARAIADLWHPNADAGGSGSLLEPESPVDPFFRVPDAALVAEPTSFHAIVAHQGVVRWRCHTMGRAAHTSRPDLGSNAIYAMARIVQAIERLHSELSTSGPLHALCGRPSVCVGTIHGGIGVNTVPEAATIEIDRRLGPSESPTAAYQELIDYISKQVNLGDCQVRHNLPFMQSPGLSEKDNRELAKRLVTLVCKHGRDGATCGAPYGTDGAAYAAIGLPTVVFGPGSIDQAHTADEYIAIDELQLATEIFYDIACNGLRS